MGNTDRRILRILRGKPLKKPRKVDKRVMYFWSAKNLGPKNIEYLKSLPNKTDFIIGKMRIGVFHGTCDDKDEMLFPDTPESRFRELARSSPFQIHIMGHSHTPFYRTIDDIHFINPGSVGRMFDGDPRASFAILKIHSGKIEVEHFRIPYPVNAVIEDLKNNRLPKIYAKMYRVGRKLN